MRAVFGEARQTLGARNRALASACDAPSHGETFPPDPKKSGETRKQFIFRRLSEGAPLRGWSGSERGGGFKGFSLGGVGDYLRAMAALHRPPTCSGGTIRTVCRSSAAAAACAHRASAAGPHSSAASSRRSRSAWISGHWPTY